MSRGGRAAASTATERVPQDPYAKFALRRTNLIFKDVPQKMVTNQRRRERRERRERTGKSEEEERQGITEVRTQMVDPRRLPSCSRAGLQSRRRLTRVSSAAPSTCVGKHFGWQFGNITDVITEEPLLACTKGSTFALYGQISQKVQPVSAFKITRLVQMRDSTLGSSWSRVRSE